MKKPSEKKIKILLEKQWIADKRKLLLFIGWFILLSVFVMLLTSFGIRENVNFTLSIILSVIITFVLYFKFVYQYFTESDRKVIKKYYKNKLEEKKGSQALSMEGSYNHKGMLESLFEGISGLIAAIIGSIGSLIGLIIFFGFIFIIGVVIVAVVKWAFIIVF